MGNKEIKLEKLACIEADEKGKVVSTQVGNLKLDLNQWVYFKSIASSHWILLQNYLVRWNGTVFYMPGKYIDLFKEFIDKELSNCSLHIYKPKNYNNTLYVLI